jgi:hypothetical protein
MQHAGEHYAGVVSLATLSRPHAPGEETAADGTMRCGKEDVARDRRLAYLHYIGKYAF